MDTDNPYRGPSSELAEQALAVPLEAASKARRFLNWLIDRLVAYGVLMAAIIVVLLVDEGGAVAQWLDGIDTLTDYAITYATMLVYYTLMEGLFGVTIGKLVTGTRVVDVQGRQATLARCLLRSLCRFIPFDFLSLAFSDDDVRRAWHDSLSGTRVVRRARATPAKPATVAAQGFTVSDSTTMSST